MRRRRFWIAAKSESGKPSIHLQCCFPISLSSPASSWWYWWLHQCPRGPHCSIYWILEAAIDLFNYLYIFPFLQHCTDQISSTRNAAGVVMRQFVTKKTKNSSFSLFSKTFFFFWGIFHLCRFDLVDLINWFDLQAVSQQSNVTGNFLALFKWNSTQAWKAIVLTKPMIEINVCKYFLPLWPLTTAGADGEMCSKTQNTKILK